MGKSYRGEWNKNKYREQQSIRENRRNEVKKEKQANKEKANRNNHTDESYI